MCQLIRCSPCLITALMLAIGAAGAIANGVGMENVVSPLLENSAPGKANSAGTLRKQIEEKGSVRVIVGLRIAFVAEGMLDAAGVAQQRGEISRMQAAVLDKVPSLKLRPEKVKRFDYIPFMSLEVDAAELEALAGLAEIASIEEDRLSALPAIGNGTVVPESNKPGEDTR